MRKFLPYILILIILVGLFSPIGKVNAQTPRPLTESEQQQIDSEQSVLNSTQAEYNRLGNESGGTPETIQARTQRYNELQAVRNAASDHINFIRESANRGMTPEQITQNTGTGVPTADTSPASSGDSFKDEVFADCGIKPWTWPACFLSVGFYYLFLQIPSFLLWLSAQLFNTMIFIGISSSITSDAGFIPSAWAVVRDLSNIFFILILLYIAIKTILGMGGHEVQKMIRNVIIMALLINFSMFFTKVVIDSSNILALVFYNKLDENQQNSAGNLREYTPVTIDKSDKDLSGFMYKNFDATQLLTGPALEKLKTATIDGKIVPQTNLPLGLKIGIILIAGLIMLVAAYAFFVSAFMFIGRLIELWVLIIFSPFAFMSFTVPRFASVEYLGWEDWIKRLISTSFMAPIFMFFMYLIFKLIGANIFTRFPNSQNTTGALANILGILIPAMIILALLLKAAKFAEKGGGAFGEMVVKYGKMAGGLALGAATGGAAVLGAGAIGSLASRAASNEGLQAASKKTGFGGAIARLGLKTADYGSRASFDIRKAPGVGALAKAGGLNLGTFGAREGGYEKMRADKVKKRQERAKQLEVREDETLKQNLNKTEADLQSLLNANSLELSELDKFIEKKREALRDTTAQFGAGSNEATKAGRDLSNYKNRKKALKDGKDYAGDIDTSTGAATTTNAKNYTNRNAGTYVDAAGVTHTRTINHMEDIELRDRKHDIEVEERERKRAYANRIEGKGSKIMFWRKTRANREAAHNVRMGAKVEKKGEH